MSEGHKAACSRLAIGLLVQQLRREQQIDLHYSPNGHVTKQEQLQVINFSSHTQQSLFSARLFMTLSLNSATLNVTDETTEQGENASGCHQQCSNNQIISPCHMLLKIKTSLQDVNSGIFLQKALLYCQYLISASVSRRADWRALNVECADIITCISSAGQHGRPMMACKCWEESSFGTAGKAPPSGNQMAHTHCPHHIHAAQ